jgi:hypothetical protein
MGCSREGSTRANRAIHVCVALVALAGAGIDRAELAGVGDEHFMSESFKEAAGPRAVLTDLYRDPAFRILL